MNYITRALKNVTRKLSKSILLAVTFFVIGNFVIIGLGVSSASENAKILTRQKMRAVVEFKSDWNAFYEEGNKIEDEEERAEFFKKGIEGLNAETVNTILKDERVKTANALYTSMVYAEGFEYVRLNNKAEENYNRDSGGSVIVGGGASLEGGGGFVYVPANLKLQGNLLPDMVEFADGMYVLKEGRMYTQEDIDNKAKVILITDTLAELNNLKVGDTISVAMMNKSDLNSEWGIPGLTEEDIMLDFEIIGIFDNTSELDPNSDEYQYMDPWQSPDNVILAPRTSILEYQLNMALKNWEHYKTQYPDDVYYQDPANIPTEESMGRVDAITILLNDPLEVERFVEDFSATAPKFTVFDANNETFDKLSKPLDTMSLFANFIVWLVIINAAIIITLVTALTLKTREYEIGVLLSMGVSKAKIVGQFFIELAIIAIIGFSLAVLSGSLVAKQVGNTVLEYQVSVSDIEEEDDNGMVMWGQENYFTEITLDDIVAEYEVTISPLIIAEIYIAGLGIVLVSILIPSLMIMRFNPKRILMNTN